MKTLNFKQIVLNIIAAVLALAFVFPIYVLVTASVKPLQEIFDMRLIPKTFTLASYIEIFTEQHFEVYLQNSAYIAIAVTLLSLFFHSMAAYALARFRFPGRTTIFIGILSTLMIPFAVIMIPLFLIVREFGLINNLWGIIIPSIPNAFGIFLLHQFFLGIPKELEEAAKIDGSSRFGTYWRIALPLSKPILLTLAVAYFLGNWNNYLWPLIVTTKRELWVIQIAIANFRSERLVDWNLILAASCLASLPVIVLFSYFQKYLVDGIKTSGLKE
jgi:multiple sugar transport system permease protein